MASDNHANYGRIGFTVFLGALALAISLIYIAGIGNRDNEVLIETYYDNPVSGLSVGSAVNFRGVKIGEVREITFVSAVYDSKEITSNDFQRVIIVMALDCRRLDVTDQQEAEEVLERFISVGVRATIASNAVTGMSRVEFNIPDNPMPIDKPVWKPRHIQVPPQPSLIENLSVSVAKTLHTFNKMDLNSVFSNINVVASSSAKITTDVSDFVNSEKSGLSTIVNNLKNATASIDELAATLKDNPSLLLRAKDPERLHETE